MGSIKLGGPPILFCMTNGKGKTTALGEIHEKLFPIVSVFTQDFDYGGFKVAFAQGKLERKETLIFSDLQFALEKSRDVTSKTLSAICQMIDKTEGVNLNFQTFQLMKDIKDAKGFHTMNVIIGCTPDRIDQLERWWKFDFLSRFIVLRVERREEIDYNQPFKLRWTAPAEKIPLVSSNSFFHSENPRYSVYKRHLQSIAIAYKLPPFTYQTYDVEHKQFRTSSIDAMNKLSKTTKESLA